MGISSLVGHASTDIGNPISSAICDICGQRWNHNRLDWQHEWQGNAVVNLRLLACPSCLDVPNEQLRALVLPPDPVPTKDPRPEPFAQDANPSMVTNWDTPGASWDQPSNQQGVPINTWDNTVPD